MKNLTLIALLFLTTFIACKKDKAEKNTDRLEGKWKVESVTFLKYENGKEVDSRKESLPNQIFDFRSDGSASVNLDGEDVEVKWTATDALLQLDTQRDVKLDLKIKSLSKTNLLLSYDLGEDVENGITYKETVEVQARKME